MRAACWLAGWLLMLSPSPCWLLPAALTSNKLVGMCSGVAAGGVLLRYMSASHRRMYTHTRHVLPIGFLVFNNTVVLV